MAEAFAVVLVVSRATLTSHRFNAFDPKDITS
jgi:hypothetical protein